MSTPGLDLVIVHLFVVGSGERRDGAVKRHLMDVRVGLGKLEVRAQCWHDEGHQLAVLENFLRRAAESVELFEEVGVRQVVGRCPRVGQVRGSEAGNEQMVGPPRIESPQPAGELERYYRPHTVSKEGKGLFSAGGDHLRQRVDQGSYLSKRWFQKSIFPTRELNDTDLDVSRQFGVPLPEDGRAAAREGEAEELKISQWPATKIPEP